MKVLIVCSRNSGRIAPFITEQGDALATAGVDVEYFPIEGKGFRGYLKNRKSLLNTIRKFKPDLIHAHYGLSGLLVNTQRRIPVVTTYHGSDINNKKIYPFSRLNMMLSAHNIFVSYKNLSKSGLKRKYSLIPCGVTTKLFIPGDKQQARKALNLQAVKKYVLFAGAFNITVKNAALARSAISVLPDVEIIELNGYSRELVVQLLNAVDAVLMTSFSEGSPQIIKEALACNCPVVSVPVGDVQEMIENIPGCFITSYEPEDIADKLQQALNFGRLTEGRKKIEALGLDAESVAGRILEVYKNVLIKK